MTENQMTRMLSRELRKQLRPFVAILNKEAATPKID